MYMFRLGIIGFRSMDSWASLKEKIPTVRLRHLRTRGKQTLPSSESSSGMNSIPNWLLFLVLKSCGQK
jgi:hypothetical protein